MKGFTIGALGRLGLVLLLGVLATACSSINYYPNTLDKNVLVKTTLGSGSMFSDISAHLHVYSINNQCEQAHLGAVALDKPEVEVGIATGKPVVIEVAFGRGGGFFSSSSSVTRVETLLTPKKNFFYEVNASYVDGIYDFEVFEKKQRNARGRLLPMVHSSSCKSK
jgi:hypothetical protein